MTSSLLTLDGFPRSDIDIVRPLLHSHSADLQLRLPLEFYAHVCSCSLVNQLAVRHARIRLLELRNDRTHPSPSLS